jgi:hypothetical protein
MFLPNQGEQFLLHLQQSGMKIANEATVKTCDKVWAPRICLVKVKISQNKLDQQEKRNFELVHKLHNYLKTKTLGQN